MAFLLSHPEAICGPAGRPVARWTASVCNTCVRAGRVDASGYCSLSNGTVLPLNCIGVRAGSSLAKPDCSLDLTCPLRPSSRLQVAGSPHPSGQVGTQGHLWLLQAHRAHLPPRALILGTCVEER